MAATETRLAEYREAAVAKWRARQQLLTCLFQGAHEQGAVLGRQPGPQDERPVFCPVRCELEDGPLIAAETARRLGCDAEHMTSIENEGLPLSVGRRRRTVPPRLRRLVEARDQGRCRWPGCDNQHHLAAHHRTHWAHGGQTSLHNLILLCRQHHRLVHEGGYTTENSPTGELRFRNRHGLLHPTIPRSPPGSTDELITRNTKAGLTITPTTNKNGDGDRMHLDDTVCALQHIIH